VLLRPFKIDPSFKETSAVCSEIIHFFKNQLTFLIKTTGLKQPKAYTADAKEIKIQSAHSGNKRGSLS
jgi:hypothetical protein